MTASTTIHLQRCLQRLGEHDPTARSELLEFAKRRLQLLASRMFQRYPHLYAREQSEDLYQDAMLRLWQALEAVGPTTVAAFMGLAALQMRRALCDLARKHFGRDGERNLPRTISTTDFEGASTEMTIPMDDGANAPEEMACWSEFHSAANTLPEPLRTAFDLLFYNGLPQSEVAALMNISVRQVQRHWSSARLKLSQTMGDSWPNL